MSFTDRARIHVQGGRGGNGCLSFRREAHVPKGGPDGGNGGRGGRVLLVVDETMEDLSRFRHAVHHRADSGGHGQGARKHGRGGDDLQIAVPVGTRVLRDDMQIALMEPGDVVQVAQGGDGGIGNRAFRSSTNQAPRQTIPGTDGEATWLTLELRLDIAVALVGLPNSGKTLLLSALTGAPQRDEPWPHSTTEPGFGPLEDDYGEQHLVADLPGIGRDGTPRAGHALDQLERVRVVIHCVDATDPEPASERIGRVRAALAEWVPDGATEVVVACAADPAEPEAWADFSVDSASGGGISALREHLLAAVAAEEASP